MSCDPWRHMQEEKGRADKAAERIRAIKVWRGEAAERASGAREMRVARNRYVLRAHERLLRDMNRLKEDDRTRRMEALKVTDFPATHTPKALRYDWWT